MGCGASASAITSPTNTFQPTCVIDVQEPRWTKDSKLTPDQNYLLVSFYNYIKIWTADKGTLIGTVHTDSQIRSFKVTKDGQYLVVHTPWQFYLWNLPDVINQGVRSGGQENVKPTLTFGAVAHLTIELNQGSISNFTISKDQQYVLAAYSKEVRIFTLPDGKRVGLVYIQPSLTRVISVKLTKNGQTLITQHGKQIRCWDFQQILQPKPQQMPNS